LSYVDRVSALSLASIWGTWRSLSSPGWLKRSEPAQGGSRAHASGQITDVGSGIRVCCDHILTRKKTSQNHATEAQKGCGEAAVASIE